MIDEAMGMDIAEKSFTSSAERWRAPSTSLWRSFSVGSGCVGSRSTWCVSERQEHLGKIYREIVAESGPAEDVCGASRVGYQLQSLHCRQTVIRLPHEDP